MASSGFDQVERLVGRLKPARWKDPEPVRNLTVDGCAPALAGASVNALHTSRVPLAADEIAFWPTNLTIRDGAYVKELTVESLDGRQSRLILPLFNRQGLRTSAALTPNVYRASAARSRSSVRVAFRAEIDLGQLTRVQEGDRARVPMYECDTGKRIGKHRLRIDAITLLEALIAKDEPMFRLLLSPFRELNVMHRRIDGMACVAVLDAAAFEPRTGTTLPSTTFSLVSCLAYWFGEPGRLSELATCARSILGTGPLHVPKCAGVTPVNVSGYQVDGLVQIQRIAPAQLAGFWPISPRCLVMIDLQKEAGRRFDVLSRKAASPRARAAPSEDLDECEYRKYRAWFG